MQTPAFIEHPDRTDRWIWLGLSVITVVTLVFYPLRVWLLNNPVPYALLVGGYTSAIVGGAESTQGGTAAWFIVACTLIGALWKLPIWWAVGSKWGRDYLALLIGNSARMARRVTWLDGIRFRWLLAMIIVSYVPFFPTLVIANILAAIKGIRLRILLVINAFGVLLRSSVFVYLGMRYGQEVTEVVQYVNRYATWITVALLIFVIWSSVRGQSSKKALSHRNSSTDKALSKPSVEDARD